MSRTPRVVCRVGDVVRCGRAVTVECRLAPTELAEAVRREPEGGDRIAVAAPDPTRVHDYVGCIRPEMGLRTRTALARAARTLGVETPHDEDLERARQSLADLAVSDDTTDRRAKHRHAVARTTEETEQLRERVAAARGRLQTRREHGLDRRCTGPRRGNRASLRARDCRRGNTRATRERPRAGA